jgi:hypothetical protein
MESIFVQLASYHDYELPRTILDAISKSSGKYQINFGVHYNYFEVDDIELPDLPNVKIQRSKAPHNLGMGISRAVAHQFYDGEDYYLQVDAHTRFRENWDENYVLMIEYYQRLGFEKPLLTSYPKNYWYEGDEVKMDKGWSVSCISFEEDKERFMRERIPSQMAWACPSRNLFTRSVSGGSIFTIGPFIKPNPDMHSVGEEILIAARAFTSGYDLLVPKEGQLAHLYYNHLNPPINKRRMVWLDFQELSVSFEHRSAEELRRIFRENLVGEHYFGTERSLADFEVFSGLDFTTGIVVDKSLVAEQPGLSRLEKLSCPVSINY